MTTGYNIREGSRILAERFAAGQTHCNRVLALLSDGRPHSHHELYGLGVIAHSRISDLRKRGHVIESWREDDLYLYRLCPEGPSVLPSSSDGFHSEPDAALIPTAASSGQLSLEAA